MHIKTNRLRLIFALIIKFPSEVLYVLQSGCSNGPVLRALSGKLSVQGSNLTSTCVCRMFSYGLDYQRYIPSMTSVEDTQGTHSLTPCSAHFQGPILQINHKDVVSTNKTYIPYPAKLKTRSISQQTTDHIVFNFKLHWLQFHCSCHQQDFSTDYLMINGNNRVFLV